MFNPHYPFLSGECRAEEQQKEQQMSTPIISQRPIPLEFSATDPHRLAQTFLKQRGRDPHGAYALRYWRDEFWRFKDGRYHKLPYSELQAEVSEFIREKFVREKVTNKHGQIIPVTRNVVGNAVQAITSKILVPAHVDQPVWLGKGSQGPFFVFNNGMLNVDALIRADQPRLSPHSGDWFTQTTFPYDYNAAATCPGWLKFLDEVLEGDQERIRLLQQWFGYCLTADTTQQKFVVAVGEGQNGKSVALDLLTAMLGPDNVSHVRVELFAQRFQLTMTLGKLANISYDTGEIDESAEATIKEFTGGDRMYFDRKGIPGVNACPTARLILATNHDPRFADRSKGIWRRMIVIPFRVSIEPERQDPQLASKLKVELPGVFNWAVDGLRDLQRQRQFTAPTICREAWEQFRAESNPTREFLTDNYKAGSAEESIPCGEVYAEYHNFLQSQRLKALDATTFGKELRKLFPTAERRRDGGGERLWKYHGLRRIETATLTAASEA